MAIRARARRDTTRPDPLAEGSPPEPAKATGWLRAHGVTLAAVALIAAQLGWKATLLAHSYFRQDDYQYLGWALDSGLGWKYVMLVDDGHLAPLGMVLNWILVRISLFSWPLICAVILPLLAAACFAMLRMLRTVFGNRPAILIPLGLFLFSPLSLAAADWWAVAFEILPLEIAMFMAIDAHVRYLRDGSRRAAVTAAIWLAVGLASSDKGAVVPLVLFGLTAAFFVTEPRTHWAKAVVAADIVPVIFGRLEVFPATLLGVQTRYVTDATGILALCAGLAFLPVAGEQDAYRLRAGALGMRVHVRAVIAVLACAFLAGAAVSLQGLESVTAASVTQARSYIATMRVAVTRAPHGATIVAGATPAFIMQPGLFWLQGYTSKVAGPIAQTEPPRQLTFAAAPLAVSFGGKPGTVWLPAGNNVVYLPVLGAGDSVRLQLVGGATASTCVTDLTVGSLQPVPGHTTPAAPVPG